MAIGFALINTMPGVERGVYKDLLNALGVTEITPVLGPYDFIAKIENGNWKTIERIAVTKVGRIFGTKKALVLLRARNG